MRGREFLTIASFLESIDSEASLRTQIGRHYYAAYLEARRYCELHLGYIRTRSAREHTDIPRILRAMDSDLADNLAFLRGFRNGADYDMDLGPDTVALQLLEVQRRTITIIAQLDELIVPNPDEESPDLGTDA